MDAPNDTGLSGIASSLIGVAERQLLAVATDGKASLIASIGEVVTGIEDIAGRLDGPAAPLADIMKSAADSIAGIAQDLDSRSIPELIEDGRQLVRAQPAVAVGIAAGIGFLLARLVKAAAED
jgi:ElaB/YqjD/DUF883 family membrane-anchored ribosome-binding protein